MPVRDIDSMDIENLLQRMSGLKLSESRLRGAKVVLNETFSFAVKQLRIITENPVEFSEPKLDGKKAKERIPYNREQIHQILEKVPIDSPYRIIVILGLFCGIRIGEVLGLTWDCVNFDKMTITIEKTMENMRYNHKSFQIIKKPKSEKSVRILHISETVKQELEQLKVREEEDMQSFGELYLHPQTQTMYLNEMKSVECVIDDHLVHVGNREILLVCRKRDGGMSSPEQLMHL